MFHLFIECWRYCGYEANTNFSKKERNVLPHPSSWELFYYVHLYSRSSADTLSSNWPPCSHTLSPSLSECWMPCIQRGKHCYLVTHRIKGIILHCSVCVCSVVSIMINVLTTIHTNTWKQNNYTPPAILTSYQLSCLINLYLRHTAI